MDSLFDVLFLLLPIPLLLGCLALLPAGSDLSGNLGDANSLDLEIDEETRRLSEIEQERAA